MRFESSKVGEGHGYRHLTSPLKKSILNHSRCAGLFLLQGVMSFKRPALHQSMVERAVS